ncbi:MAG: VTT domain-containing protein [Pseudotabrizicola sp.]|uniref:DedA family protein n=1 Tax=Pseudotabrizicola sp. TaxID=2939647 RepID=UPI00271849AB|nr:VTT domain-containing protein [Pseudotabrizicola sp.]MDO8884470.1 VTT domain-containing protein [Pseudotabrizicola sp.]MDP2081347.1 VTT domain-containing protein [Pseudotabrizicola sp.]MDZ7576034.1 VTT domain-containing protein [Pseudotabrizicola sp.]
MTEADVGALIRDYGLLIIAPVAVLEGPVISVISGYLAKAGLVPLRLVFLVLLLADLAGDILLYVIGRKGRAGMALPWLSRFGVTRRRLASVIRAFRKNDARILVLGKLTHSAGFAVLLAAGMARMPFLRFLALNTAATVPKVALCMAVGWWFGAIGDRVGPWLLGATVLTSICIALFAAHHFRSRKRSDT